MSLNKLADVCLLVYGVLLSGSLPKVNSNHYVFFMTLPITSGNEKENADASCQPHMSVMFSGNSPCSGSFKGLCGSVTPKIMLLSELKNTHNPAY